MKKYECCCIGRSCVDYIALVKKYPQKNTKVPLLEYKICLGGQAANSALVLSHLGIKTLLVSPIGKDYHGKLIRNFLKKYKNNLDVLTITKTEIITPVAFIWTEQTTAERTIVYEKIESNTLYSKNILENVVKNTNYILFDHQSSKDIFKVIHLILRNNVKLMADVERKDVSIFKMLPYINYFICSKEFVNEIRFNVK
ncbi:MAG: carbohydrate kinase family protein, partial [Endomicrobia bacterium]|nr:carbohydrate kinase family protein [Endomicrobiia bacterium]